MSTFYPFGQTSTGATGYLQTGDAIGVKGNYLTQRPAIYYGKYSGAGFPKPTIVERGAFLGFSMPIYSADDEELFFRDYVPGRWDGASNPIVQIKYYIDTANTAGEKFQFQLSWANSAFTDGVSAAIGTSTTDVKGEITIVAGGTAQYSPYKKDYTIAYDTPDPDIVGGDLLAFPLRRIAVEGGSDECEGEIVVTDISIKYKVDKVYKTS